jgi:L-iditol 2-dehydrogenase
MRAFVQSEVGRFEERELPAPSPARGEIVVRVSRAVTCGTDLKILERGHPRVALPLTMGHELAGEVAAVGEGVSGWRPGERVVPGVSGPCGACADCRGGRGNLCRAGHSDRTWGAFAELVRVPASVVARNLHRVPDGLALESAAFLDPLASVLHGWGRLRAPAGTLLVYGAGALAFLWAAVARLHGVSATVVGRRAERAALAERFGAGWASAEDAASGRLEPADAAVDATGDPSVWERLPWLVRQGGEVLLFGGCAPGTTVTFDAERLHYAEISLIGAFHSTPEDAREALALLASGRVDPAPLVSGRGGWSELPRFLAAQARGEGVRYVIAADA